MKITIEECCRKEPPKKWCEFISTQLFRPVDKVREIWVRTANGAIRILNEDGTKDRCLFEQRSSCSQELKELLLCVPVHAKVTIELGTE